MTATDYKRPESVLVVVHTRDGRVLVLRRREPADFWQSVTGSLRWGEDCLAAAQRELLEETGLSAEGMQDRASTNRFPILPAWRARYAPHVHENVEHVFTLELPAPVDVRLNEREHTEYHWLSRAQALERVSSYTNRQAILDYVAADAAR